MVFLVFPKNKLGVRFSLLIVVVCVVLLYFRWILKATNMQQRRNLSSQKEVKNSEESGASNKWKQTKDLDWKRSEMLVTDINCNSEVEGNEMCPVHYNSLSSCDLYEGGFDCPDIRSKVNGTVRQAQLVTVRMLRMLDCIASKYGVRYWLKGNSLLGAYRHKGSVPWIIGLEVGMCHKDVRSFVKHFIDMEIPGICLLGRQTSSTTSTFEIITRSTPDLNKINALQLRDEQSCYKKCTTEECKWIGGLSLSITMSLAVSESFPLCRMSFEGWFVPVPCKAETMLGRDLDYLNAIKRTSKRRPNVHADPFHKCDKLP